jgi:hypothetical protein
VLICRLADRPIRDDRDDSCSRGKDTGAPVFDNILLLLMLLLLLAAETKKAKK